MAIGDTVNAGLMRVDFSPFLEAGRANAAANASFGQALGQVAKGFIDGQEKKKRSNEIAGFLIGQGVGEKDAMAIAKNPFLQKEYQRKQEAEAKMKMEKERLNAQASMAAQGRAQAQAFRDDENERKDKALAKAQAQEDEIKKQDDIYDQFLKTEGSGLLQTEQGQGLFSSMVEAGLDPSDALKNLQSFEQRIAQSQPKAPDPQVQIKNENDLRKEFNSLPEVKDFNKVRTSYDKVVLAGENPSAAGDISMIFNYMKILDPGSVVREGEFATAQNAAGVPQRVINQYNKIVKGERLSEDQRSDFMNQARFAAEAQFKPVSEQMTRYQGVARNMGLRLDQVLPTSFLTMGEQLGQEFKTKPDSNSDANSIKTDQGDYSIEGLSVEAQ